jgi:hypothetical protein
VRQSAWVVHAVEQKNPLPLARRSVQTAPLGHVSPAQPYVHIPPGSAEAQLEPALQMASLAQASPMVRVDTAVLQTPLSHT